MTSNRYRIEFKLKGDISLVTKVTRDDVNRMAADLDLDPERWADGTTDGTIKDPQMVLMTVLSQEISRVRTTWANGGNGEYAISGELGSCYISHANDIVGFSTNALW